MGENHTVRPFRMALKARLAARGCVRVLARVLEAKGTGNRLMDRLTLVLLIAAVCLSAGFVTCRRHVTVDTCVVVSDDGTAITYPPVKGHCVPAARPPVLAGDQ